MNEPKPKWTYDLRVYFDDTDAAGVVYYGNYLKFMERARSEWFIHHGMGMKALMNQHHVVFVVRATALQYHRAAQLEDVLQVTATLSELNRASASFEQTVWRGDERICSGSTQVACVDTTTFKPKAIPLDVRAQLQPYLTSA